MIGVKGQQINKVDEQNEKKTKNIRQYEKLSRINYSSLSNLQSCLKDSTCLQIYRSALSQSRIANKKVIHLASDINCLYSIWAAKAGASIVYCILNDHSESEIKNQHMIEQVIKQNNLSHKIQVHLWKNFKIDYKVDVIIAEPMGYNLFYDGMIHRIIETRDMYLNKKDGIIIPNRLAYNCSLVWDQYQKDEKIQYWNQVYGVSMKNMKNWIQQQPIIRTMEPTLIVSDVSKLFQFNLYKTDYNQIDEIKKTVCLHPLNSSISKANGLTIWFQVFFEQPDGTITSIDTSPWSQQSRWSNFTLFSRTQWNLSQKQALKIQFISTKNSQSGANAIRLIVDKNQNIYKVH